MSKTISYVAENVSIATGATRYPIVVTVPAGGRILEAAGSFDGQSSTEDQLDCRLSKVTGTAAGGSTIAGVPLDDADSVPSGFSGYKGPATGLTEGVDYFRDYISPQASFRYAPGIRASASTQYAIVVTPGAQTHNGNFRIVVGF